LYSLVKTTKKTAEILAHPIACMECPKSSRERKRDSTCLMGVKKCIIKKNVLKK
jgi:hypothetical protein